MVALVMPDQAHACAASTQAGITYLSGCDCPEVRTVPGVGVILTPNMGNRPSDLNSLPWAADNGCFSQSNAFSLGRFILFLEQMTMYRTRCLFAVAPDVVADAEATWERSRIILPVLRSLGYPAALVAQDGIEQMRVEWDAFDALFIGGSTRWKLSPMAARIAAEAKRRGKHVHMGRVNSGRRLRYAYEIGCDSADGTFLAFGPDKNIARIREWINDLCRQPSLWTA